MAEGAASRFDERDYRCEELCAIRFVP
jgi:hypothetical protein